MKSLAIVIPATKSYLYAIHDQALRLQPIIKGRENVTLIFVTDKSEEAKKAFKNYEFYLPSVNRIHCPLGIPEYVENRGEEASLLMSRMQSFGFAQAKILNVDLCLSLEADILPPPNALRVCEDILSFDDGYYSIAAATYFNGAFLGGRGTYQNAIAEDFLPEEREIPTNLLKEWQKTIELKFENKDENEKKGKKIEELHKKIKEFPPKGNVFELNAKNWRKRGWLEHAYPAIGRGSIVPSDWCGLGFTLMNRKALDLADFTGFDGKGTQDLYLCWHRWNPNGLRIGLAPHVLCDHIKRVNKELVNWHAYHEPIGECEGHIRMIQRPYFPMSIPVDMEKQS